MKKLIIGALCFAVGALGAFAATKTVTWSLPTDWESSADFGYPSDPVGAPALKFIPVSIKVAEGSVYSNCTVEATWVATDDPRPEVINEPHIVGEAPILSPEDPQYWNAAYFPATPENVGGIQTCAGEAAIMAWVTPYRWNGRTQKLEKATALKLTFTYEAPRAKLRLTTSSANDKTGVMYIISPPNFKTLWQAYVDYRQTTHPDVEFHIVDTVSEIYNVSPYSGGRDDAQRIHKFLEAKYAIAKAAGQKMYAILGAGCAKGNEAYNRDTMIPLRMTVAYSRSYFPSDLYYSCMDKRDNKGEVWDYDNDGYFLGTSKSNSDPEWKIDWQPDIVALRFPVRTTVYLQNVSGSASRSYTAQEQINGLVNKLKIYEGATGASRTFGGYFRYSVSYHRLFEDVSRGSTDDKVAGEHTFFDGIENMWTANHTAVFEDSERNVRHINHSYETAYRPLAGAVNNTQVYNNDLEINTHNSHGQEQTAAPFQAYDFFSNGRIQFFMNYGNSCLTGKIDTGDVDGHGNLSFAEACILNPNGGAIVTLNNTREGYGAIPGYRELMSLAMQIGMIKGFYSLGDGSVYEAFIKGHQYSKNSVGFSGAGGCMAACYVEANTMGDPLARLKPIASSATMESTVNGFFATTGTLNGDTSVNGVSGVVNLNVNTAGNTITLGGGSQFKATGKLTVNGGGTLKWNAPGGVGRNGVAFTTRGRLVCEGNASRYFGARFSGLDEILVTGYNTTLDFDKTGATRDVSALKFIGSDSGGIAKCNYIRSREAGIFKADMSIPVQNGTLVLQTTNIGGSGNASNTTTPIFTLTNAVLKIVENPHWGNEMINRPIWMNGATITVAYQSFGFGAKVSGSKGMTLRVLDKTTNTISGNYDAEINGAFRVEVASNAVLKINVPLTKSSYTGSLVKSGEGQLELRAANTFTGGIAINKGTVVFGKEALTSSACGTVTVENGATLKIESLPLASVTKLTVKAGGKLILPGDASTASYQLVDPSVGSLDFADGALVYNEHNLTTPLKGSATSDGYYMDTSSFLHWQDQNGTWSTDSSGTKWLKGGTEQVSYANGNSVQFPDHGAKTHDIAVSGTIEPGYITFNNSATAYNFTGSGSKISIENLYTVGDTTFQPDVSVGSKTVVTSGKTTYNNLTTASASVSPKGELQLTGTLTPATYIKQIVLKVTSVVGDNSKSWLGVGTLYFGYQINGLRFYCDGALQTLPVGTTVSATGSFNGSTLSSTMTVKASSNGVVTQWDGDTALRNVFDDNASGGWGCASPAASSMIQKNASFTITINLGAPMRMFTKYGIAGGDTTVRSAKNWSIAVVENKSGGSYTVDTRTSGTTGNSWSTFDGIQYSGASSTSVNVSDGGTLFLNGTYNAPITVGADSTLAVTNAAKLTANKGFTLNGNVTLDVSEAQKSTWFEVLHGANLAADTLSKFSLNSDDAAAKITGGNLYVATKDVKKGPYTRTMTGDTWDWNTTDWSGAGTPFGITWADAITRMSDNTIVTINNSSTGTLNCAVICNTIFFTNETDNVQTVRVNGTGSVSCNTLDFSGLKGEITWAPDLGGANVVAGTNRVILLKGVGNTVSVASNGYVSTVGTFTSYDIQPETRMHFANAGRAVNMSQLPSQGILSFDGMTIQSGVQGAFQKQNVTFLVEDNQSLKLSDTTGFNGRCLASFDVRGGNVTIEPGGAWWFGQNGVTKYNQTGGTFTCNASAGNSVLFGYQGESSFLFDINVAGGTFEIPNALANIYNPANINIGTNGVFRAKGITVRDGVNGTVNINEQGTLEVGSSGLATARVAYNLFGGTLAAFENVSVGAPIELGSVGTLAAKTGTTLTYNGTIKAENATLKFGREGYAGTVKLAEIPAGVTNYQIVAGTWDLGELRPTNDIPVSVLTGKIAAQLTDAELREAASDEGFRLIKTSLPEGPLDAGHVAVVTRSGTAVTAMGRVQGGYIYLSINYVYPLYGEVKVEGEQRWADIAWHDSIGMPFNGEWSAVQSAVLSNDLAGVTVTITNALTSSLKVVNSGELYINSEQIYTSLATLDDSASTGQTTIGFTANNVTAGLDTVLTAKGSGALTVAKGHKVTLDNDATWDNYNNVAEGGYVRFVKTTAATSPACTLANRIFSYSRANFTAAIGTFNWVLRIAEGDAVTMSGQTFFMPIDVTGGTLNYGSGAGECYYGGNSSTATNSVITVNGGAMNVNVTGTATTGSSNRGFIIGVTRNGVTKYPALVVNDGIFDCAGGLLSPWENCSVTVNGGTLKAKGIWKGGINGGSLNLKGGVVEIGSMGIGLRSDATASSLTFNLAGGTIRATDNVTLSLAPATSGTSYLQAAPNKTLTMNVIPTGNGTIICGDATNNGTVEFTGGDYSNVTLGGTFTIRLTDTQKTATVNTPLFKAAAGLDPTKVTVRNSDGSAATGAYHIADGKFQWVPANAYVMPIRAAVSNDVAWTAIDWYDSSATPKKVTGDYLTASGASATFELTVVSNAVLSGTATAGTLTVSGEGALTIPSTLTVNTMKGDGTVVADAYRPGWGGLTANTWAGTVKLTGALPEGSSLSNLGNANSTIEFAGTFSTYLAVDSTVNGRFILTGTLSSNNGNSGTVQAVFNGPFEGTGTLAMTDHGTMTSADIYKILGDMSNFRGTISVGDTMRSVTIGAHNAGNGYLYITENKGATIAAGKQWSAASGCAINVDAGGVLNIEYRTGIPASTSTVSVQSGGYVNLKQTDVSQTVWPIATALNMNGGGVMINGVAISSERYTVANGTITLKASATGASMSLNIIGGAQSLPGLSIADGNYAGMVPVKGSAWNQAAQHTTTASFTEYANNLKEVLPNGTVYNGPMKATMSGNNTYVANITANNGHAQMMYGYIDDGGTGAKIIVENIPYTQYDVYVYPGGDITSTSSSFRPVTVTVGNKTAVCPAKDTNWGNANSTHGTVTLVRGSSGNFVKVEECTGSTLTVQGGTKSGNARGGIAAIQIFNTGTRVNTLTWNGGATGGTWNRTSANWISSASTSTTWNEVADGVNTAAFNGDTSLTLGATVSPDVLDIGPNKKSQTRAGYVPASSALLFSGVKLSDITTFSGDLGGGWVADAPASIFHKKVSGDTMTMQFQLNDAGYIKCAKLSLTQQGDDVYGYVMWAKNIQNGTLGVDFDNPPVTPGTASIATTDDAAGYGIKNLKYDIDSVGTLVVGGAEKFGKAFTVTNGVLTVATDALTQDVTIASGAKLNIITTDVTNEYVVTSGKIVNGGYANILVNGEAIDQDSWTLDLANGKLKRITKPGVPPFSYTISADSPTPVLWTNQQWLASNLFYVLPEEWTTGTVSEVKLTVDGNVTNTLVANANMTITKMSVLNGGYLTVTNGLVGGDILGAPFSLNITTLDDSASSGKTTLNFAPTNVTAGANTILSKSIAGKLTVNAGSKATINGTANSYEIAANGEVRFVGDKVTSVVAATETEGAIVSYRNADFTLSDTKYWTLKLYDGDYVYANVNEFINPIVVTGGELVLTNKTSRNKVWYGGENVTGKPHSSIAITGGKMTVLCTGVETAAATCGFLFGQTGKGDVTPSLTINGGDFDISGGRFTFWEKGDVTVANGIFSAKGINKHNSDALSSLTVNGGGVVALGSLGLATEKAASLSVTMNGGTLRAIDNATNSVAIALGADSANTFSAANGKTLVVSGVLSGTGAFFAGEEGYAGVVKLTAQNTFTGNVGVRAGTLDIGGETLRGEVLVAEGATLAITRDGDWGESTITSGGALNILGDVSLNGTVLERNGWTVKDGKLVVYKPDGALYWIGSVNTEWNTRDANWKDGELSVAWEDGHYEGNSAAFTNSATITMSETVRPRAITVDNGQTLTISGPTHFGRAFDLTGALKLAPTSETLYDFEASGSGAITYEGGTITSLWRGTIPDGGLTIASGALSVTNGYFGSEFNVGSANVFGTTDATLVFDLGAEGTQVIKGTTDAANRHYTIKVVSGTLNFNAGGDNTAFRGRTVAADGTNAVINLATGDATGYGNGGTVIALSNGGTLRVSSRDTLKTPLLFNGGTLELAKDCGGSGRGLDLYGNNNWAVTADSCVTYASETSDNDRKIALRNGDFTIAVEKDVTLTVEAVLAFNNGYGGTEGKLIKTGAGTLELSADNTYCKGTRIENGTLALDDGASAGTGAIEMSGGMLEFQLGTMTNDIHTTGGIINLIGELPTGEDEVAITTGAMTGEPQVQVNGEAISPSEWMVVGNKLKRVQHIEVSYGVPVTLAAGYEDKPVMFDVVDLAGGTVVINADRTLGSMAISGNGQLTLKFADEGKLTLVSGFVDPSVIIDATGLARNMLAKRSACGAPYSYWLIRGEASAAERTVELPRMPSDYAVAAEMVAGFGLRLIVTAPDDARFGVISVNLHNGTVLSGAGDHGLYPDDLANWGNLKVDANNGVTVSNATFTIGESASGWSNGNYVDTIQYQYLDDKTFERTVAIGSVPFDQYRVIVYFSTDSRKIPFAPMTVNGVAYSGLDTTTNGSVTVVGKSANWGSTGPQGGHSYELKEGVNALVTDVLTPGTVTLGFTSPGQGTARATPCAIQVVKVGEMVIGEITDYTAEIEEGTETINFSAIEWEEGPFVDGTNHTVTITAPAGCTIVIDEDLTLYNFKVIAGEGVTVKIAEDKTVSLAQGFLGEGYAIYGDFNSCLSSFATGGTTGWTDTHAVTFNYGTVNPNGQNLCFTGAIAADSNVTIYDSHAKPGCVTFGNNVSGIAGLAVNQGTVLLATTTQVMLGALSTYGEGYKRLVMAAKTNEAAIKVPYEWESVELAGVTLDIDTFTEQPIPEDVVQYKLITASSISTNGVMLGSSFKGSWKLEIDEEGGEQTLIATKTKKGFYFIITKNEQTQETEAAHATDSKQALDIDRAWVVENTAITSDQSNDVAKVTAAINGEGANGAKVWESYVLGLEPNTATSKPVIALVQSAAAENKVAFRLDNIAVNPRAGANNVTYKVWSGDAPGDKTTASPVASYTDPIAVDLPTSGVRYYHIEVLID